MYSNGIVNFHNQFQVQGPGVVTGRSGTIGKVHHVEENFWPHNTALWVTRFNDADPKFVYYLYLIIGFSRFSSGSGVPTLNRNDAHSYKVALPALKDEQAAIASVITDMDKEIDALEKRLTKTQQLKQGMMQELLTGKTRLI
ncbi:MAG: restriction endonuclease subunit S [Sedimenticola sp.]